MKITQIRKIENVDELDNYLNPKTTPVGLVKTMFKKTKDLSIVKLDTGESYGAMLYDSSRDKYMVFTDAKYSNSSPSDNKAIHKIFSSLAKDFQGIDKSLMENNRIKELKDFIAENEIVEHYGVSIDVPDLIISANVDRDFKIADDIGYGTLAGTLFDEDLIHEEKDTLSLRDFNDIVTTIKGDIIGRISEIQEIEAKSQLSEEHQQIIDFIDTHKGEGYEIGVTSSVGYASVNRDEFIEMIEKYGDSNHVSFGVYDKEGQLVDIDAVLEEEQDVEQWQDIPLGR